MLRLGMIEAADKILSMAVTIDKNNDNAWKNWGKVFDSYFLYCTPLLPFTRFDW